MRGCQAGGSAHWMRVKGHADVNGQQVAVSQVWMPVAGVQRDVQRRSIRRMPQKCIKYSYRKVVRRWSTDGARLTSDDHAGLGVHNCSAGGGGSSSPVHGGGMGDDVLGPAAGAAADGLVDGLEGHLGLHGTDHPGHGGSTSAGSAAPLHARANSVGGLEAHCHLQGAAKMVPLVAFAKPWSTMPYATRAANTPTHEQHMLQCVAHIKTDDTQSRRCTTTQQSWVQALQGCAEHFDTWQ